jgi:hypothetical protein
MIPYCRLERRQPGEEIMKLSRLALAVLAVGFSIGAAQAITVHRSVTVKGSPWWVWLDIGGFCEIEDWHPAIADCDKEWKDGAVFRTLTIKGGGSILEKRTEKTATSYSYDMLDTPLPVRNYHATFKVMPVEGGTLVDWTAHFSAHNATNAEAAAVMAGIFEAGLNQIATDHK